MPKLIIHAGFPKSGTTALQAAFRENSEVLCSSGLNYPASRQDAHHSAAAALVDRSIGWNPSKRDSSSWEDFVTSIHKSDSDRILISSEFFASSTPKQIRRIRRDFKDFDIEVFFTIRPLARLIPSIYQQNLKKGSVLTYPDWISKKFLNEIGELREVPRIINHARILETWVEVFGVNSVSLILADSRSPEQLYRNVEKLLGIGELKPVESRALNRSMTLRECEILRRVNVAVRDKWTWYEYAKFVRQGYVKEITGTKNTFGERNLLTPQFLQDTVSRFARSQIGVIKSLGIHILGELELFDSRDDLDQITSLDEKQIASEFKIIMRKLNWERGKSQLNPVFFMKNILLKLSWLMKKPAE